jgi:hypothetical protein
LNFLQINEFLDFWNPKMTEFLRKLILIADPWEKQQVPIDSGLSLVSSVFIPSELELLVRVMNHYCSVVNEQKESSYSRNAPFDVEQLQKLVHSIGHLDLSQSQEDLYSVLSIEVPEVQYNVGPEFPSELELSSDQESKAEENLLSMLGLMKNIVPRSFKRPTLALLVDEEIQRFSKNGDAPKSAQLLESKLQFEMSVKKLGELNLSEFLRKCIARQSLRLEHLSSASAAQTLVEFDQLLSVYSEKLRNRESYAVSRLRIGRVREILESLATRLRYFRGQLKVRYDKMKKYSCTGLTQPDQDNLVCRRCILLASKQKEALDVAVKDCVRVFELTRPPSQVLAELPFPLQDKQKASLQISNELVNRELIDVLLYSSYESVFIYCVREETILFNKLSFFQTSIPDFTSFQDFLDRDLPAGSTARRTIIVSEEAIQVAVDVLRGIVNERAIRGKLECLISTRDVIVGILGLNPKSGADDYLPLVWFC